VHSGPDVDDIRALDCSSSERLGGFWRSGLCPQDLSAAGNCHIVGPANVKGFDILVPNFNAIFSGPFWTSIRIEVLGRLGENPENPGNNLECCFDEVL
jgi:hypothetical protein